MTSSKPRAIVIHPHEVLREKCLPMEAVSAETREIAAELRASLSATPGIGLAAPQIGIPRRMILLRCDPKTKAGGGLVMIDPVIVATYGDPVPMMEGCLSIPGRRVAVFRPEKVAVEYLSETGRRRRLDMEGLAAKCVQHEVDHLDGILILDRAAPQAPELPEETMGLTAAATAAHLSISR